jgi:Cohesin domain
MRRLLGLGFFLIASLSTWRVIAGTLVVGKLSAQYGSTVTVPITIQGTAFRSFQGTVTFDAAAVAVTELSPGSLLSQVRMVPSSEPGRLRFAAARATPSSGSGDLANLTLAISANAPAGSYAITASDVLVDDPAVTVIPGSIAVTCSNGTVPPARKRSVRH